MVERVKRLLVLVLFAACSERELDLLPPRLDASAGMDATLPHMDAMLPPMDATSPPLDAAEQEAAVPDAGGSSLVLRYDFAGSGSEIVARVGSASAFARGGAQLADGSLELDGIDDYVDCPIAAWPRCRAPP